MTLLHCDGFEGMETADIANMYTIYNGATISANGRWGGKCIDTDMYWRGIYYYLNKAITTPTYNHITIGCAAYFKSAGSYGDFFMGFHNDTRDLFLRVLSDGKLSIGMYTTTWQTTTAIWANKEEWAYWEMECKLANSDGYIKVRKNGVVIDELTLSGDTNVSGIDGINYAIFNSPNSGGSYIDDIYVIDDQGSYNNTFLGDCRVDSVFPNGAGNYSQFTPSAGNNYECVDEIPMSESDYVEGDTDGEKDSYTFADVPVDIDDSNILGIQVNSIFKRTIPQAGIEQGMILRTGGADYNGAFKDPYDELSNYRMEIWERDPSDSNIWTKAKINACEFGTEINIP